MKLFENFEQPFKNISEFIHKLDRETFRKYLILFLGAITLLAGSMVYYINNKSNSLIEEIKNIQKASFETNQIIKKYQAVQFQKKTTKNLLDKEQGFEIKSFLESFYKEHKLKPESNWIALATPLPDNNQLEEVTLQASFKKQTTEKLVKILQSLEEKEIVHIKNLKITKESTKTISFDLTVATFRYKQTIAE